MTSTGGYNPIKWDCEKEGCWNIACRPPIHFFCHALPGKISMTDLDATVEVNGNFLFLEWKSHGGEIPIGQRIYFQRLTAISKQITCIVVHAENTPENIQKICVIHGGKLRPWEPCSFEELCQRVSNWSQRVKMRIAA